MQWVEKPAPTFGTDVSSLPPEGAVPPKGGLSAERLSFGFDTSQGRRIFWGRIASGMAKPGVQITVMPSGKTATVAQVLSHARQPKVVAANHSAGIVLDRELDVSRGDWLLATDQANSNPSTNEITATVAWMDEEPLIAGRLYWALHGHRWVKAKVKRIVNHININTLESHDAQQLDTNSIGVVELVLLEPIAALPYKQSRGQGSMILVDTASHKTSGAALVL